MSFAKYTNPSVLSLVIYLTRYIGIVYYLLSEMLDYFFAQRQFPSNFQSLRPITLIARFPIVRKIRHKRNSHDGSLSCNYMNILCIGRILFYNVYNLLHTNIICLWLFSKFCLINLCFLIFRYYQMPVCDKNGFSRGSKIIYQTTFKTIAATRCTLRPSDDVKYSIW